MKYKNTTLIIILAFLVQACNLPSNIPETETPTRTHSGAIGYAAVTDRPAYRNTLTY